MSQYLGNFAHYQTIYYYFNTTDSLLGTPVVSIYRDDYDAEDDVPAITTVGVTLEVDFDRITGLNRLTIETDDGFYSVSHDYFAVITTGTIDDVSVDGTVLCSFSIENRNRVYYPTYRIRTEIGKDNKVKSVIS